RGQRGPVAAGGDVGTAQVVEDGHAGGRGETARVPDLQGAEDVAVPDLVVEGLAVGGDQVGAAVGGQDPSGRGREGLAHRGMQAAPGGDVRGGRGQHGAQGIAGGGGPGLLAHVQQVGAQGGGAVRGARELDQGHVDRVQAGAGHHPQHPHEGSSASSRSTTARIMVRPPPWASTRRGWSGAAAGTPVWITIASGRRASSSARRRPSSGSLHGRRVSASSCASVPARAGSTGSTVSTPRSARAWTSCWARAPEACWARTRRSTTSAGPPSSRARRAWTAREAATAPSRSIRASASSSAGAGTKRR